MPISLVGRVTKAGAMRKTVTVSVDRMVRHSTTHKLIRRTTKYLTHDPHDVLRAEDFVRITSCPRKSRRKHFELDVVINRGWEGQQFDKQHPAKAASVLTSSKEVENLSRKQAELREATKEHHDRAPRRKRSPSDITVETGRAPDPPKTVSPDQ